MAVTVLVTLLRSQVGDIVERISQSSLVGLSTRTAQQMGGTAKCTVSGHHSTLPGLVVVRGTVMVVDGFVHVFGFDVPPNPCVVRLKTARLLRGDQTVAHTLFEKHFQFGGAGHTIRHRHFDQHLVVAGEQHHFSL